MSPTGVAKALSIPLARVEAVLAEGTLSAAENDKAGRIVSFGGLSLRPTAHRFQVGDQALFTWCAFDTLFLPQVLGKRAKVESTCPVSGQQIRFAVTSEGVEQCTPEAPFVSLLAPGARRLKDDLRGSFCGHVHFFSSGKAASDWISNRTGPVILPLAEALEVARSFADRLLGAARSGSGVDF